jgi:PqqD family protein of HPr-rel-A system
MEPDAIDIGYVAEPAHAAFTEEIDGEAVVYHEIAETVHLLSPTATVIWLCLDGTISLQELCSELATAFGVDRARMRDDVLTAVRDFGRQGLLEGIAPDADAVAERALGDPAARGIL